MDTESFIVYVKTHDIYKDIAEYVEARFDTSMFELYRPFPKGKNKKIILSMKNERVHARIRWIKSKNT